MMRSSLPLTLGLALGVSSLAAGAGRDDLRPLPFLSDDYPRALAQARSRDLPLFVEAWAPW
jgi:hypothetical protein